MVLIYNGNIYTIRIVNIIVDKHNTHCYFTKTKNTTLNKYWNLLAPFPGQDSVVKFPVQFKIAANLATISFISYA